ncbi:methyltransferase domain-containing protein [Bradyrhizobium sp. 190]|uniref:class I SAM-dependent methyltransferase n=1 Tax=Bradyrhizobium sp. 190 TaxID=2782658 RepID=UPI001FF84317|nr:class I SAM-dependent methyltransferase [Bradyrhizobium sp. 190]MCK1511740.1 methyltransferase domain-containing protein [Bradyrhizobium sp. 190]
MTMESILNLARAGRVGRIVSVLRYRHLSRHLRARQRPLSPPGKERLVAALTKHYFRDPPDYLSTQAGKKDLDDHVIGRTYVDRRTIVPWLDTLFRLDGAKIIEIGCGTCSSTVALAEQGAEVFGYDIDEASLAVGSERLSIYGVKADLIKGNATEIPAAQIAEVNAVIYFATAEHMTLDEKLSSFSAVWGSLHSGAYLIVVETPNRLWWFDSHTALLPFYMWLPDDLATHYSRFSPRFPFNERLRPPVTAQTLLSLTRTGRAASYHEFELSLGGLSALQISSLNRWNRGNLLQFAKWFAVDRSFEKWLRRHGPRVGNAFYESYLQLAIRKP